MAAGKMQIDGAREAIRQALSSERSGVHEHSNKVSKAAKQAVLDVVKQNGKALKYVDEYLRADREFMLEVVKDSNKNYLFVGDTLKGDQELLGMVGADSYNDFIEHYEEYKTETHGTDEDEDEDEDDVIEIP